MVYHIDDGPWRVWSLVKCKALLETSLAGFVVDHTRVELGPGEQIFEAAKTAIKCWEQFQLGWVETSSRDIPIEKGQVVGVLARVFGLWCLNACRIVAVVDEVGTISRYGFVYGAMSNPVKNDFRLSGIETTISYGTIFMAFHGQIIF